MISVTSYILQMNVLRHQIRSLDDFNLRTPLTLTNFYITYTYLFDWEYSVSYTDILIKRDLS